MILQDISLGAPAWVLPAVIALAILACSIFAVYLLTPAVGWVRACAGVLKLIGVAALVLCLLEPIISSVRPKPGANVFACLVDNSQSMNIGDSQTQETRAERLAQVLKRNSNWTTRLEQDFDVRRYIFDTHLHNVVDYDALEFDGNVSAMGSALQSIGLRFRKRPIAGAFLFTDGNATDLAQLTEQITNISFPVYPVITPTENPLRDLQVASVVVTQTNFETAPITLNVTLAQHQLTGETVVVRVRDEQDQVVAEETRELGEQSTAEFRFRFRPETSGISFYHVTALIEKEQRLFESGRTKLEATLANNTRVALVDRGQGPYRILYVSGRPNWEFKFLRRALAEDDEVNLVGLLRIAPREPKFSFRDQAISERNPFFEGFDNKDDDEVERYDQSVLVRFGIEDEEELRKGFPSSADELFAYHALVIDDLEAKYFTPDQMLLIRRFVSERGGGLLMLGGQESFGHGGYTRTPVGEMLPVYLARSDTALQGEMRWELTREGALQPWLRVRATEEAERQRLRQMPPLLTVNNAGRVKPGASVLATVRADGTQHAALAMQRFGNGQVGAMLVGDLWKWAMHRPQDGEQDLHQAWRQTARWLVSDVPQRVTMQVDKDSVDHAISIRTRVRDVEFQPQDNATVTIQITAPSGQQVSVSAEPDIAEAGQYLVRYWPRETGGYRAESNVVLEDGTELPSVTTGWTSQPAAQELANLENNTALLEQIADATGGQLVSMDNMERFVKQLPSDKVPITQINEFQLWHQTWVMLFAIACLCGEWGLRRWKGLP